MVDDPFAIVTNRPLPPKQAVRQNTSLASLFRFTLAFAIAFALLRYVGVGSIPLLTLIAALAGRLLASITMRSTLLRWCVAVVAGGIVAVVACIYDSRSTMPSDLELWVFGITVCMIYGLLAVSLIEAAIWIAVQFRPRHLRRSN